MQNVASGFIVGVRGYDKCAMDFLFTGNVREISVRQWSTKLHAEMEPIRDYLSW